MRLFRRLITVIAKAIAFLQCKFEALISYLDRQFRIWGLPIMVLIIIIFLMKNE